MAKVASGLSGVGQSGFGQNGFGLSGNSLIYAAFVLMDQHICRLFFSAGAVVAVGSTEIILV